MRTLTGLPLFQLALVALVAGAASCGSGHLNCPANSATTNDAVICPAASPMVIVADEHSMTGTYALNVFNESKRKNLEIGDVLINGDHPELFTNLMTSDKTVKPGESTIVQFTWTAPSLTVADRTANLHIKSNAKNFDDLNIIIIMRSKITVGGGSSSGVAPASSSVGSSSH